MAFRIKTNDTSPKLGVTLKDADGNVVSVAGGSARFHMKAYGATTLKIDSAKLKT